MSAPRKTRREFLGTSLGGSLAAAGLLTPAAAGAGPATRRAAKLPPTLVGSANALPGMQQHYDALLAGADPLDVAVDVVGVVEADPNDHSVGLGGLPNEDGVVQLDAAVMHGPTHNAGAVASLEGCLHPSAVARLVMERTDHVLIVGPGAAEFARMHGFPEVELLTDEARRIWLRWKETHSSTDDRFPPREKQEAEPKQGRVEPRDAAERTAALERFLVEHRITGTVHCSALRADGALGCTTSTSGLAWKIPGRVGDSPIVGAGLYCDQEGGSAGATGRGEAAILANASAAVVHLLRAGAAPLDAGLEVLARVTRQARRAASWQPGLVDENGRPTFDLRLYVLAADGRAAGVSLLHEGKFALADPESGPRLVDLVVA